MNSKAITPIVSVILLLMMTVVASTAAYFWMNNIQSDIQETVGSSLDNSFTSDLTQFNIISTQCNSTGNNVTVVLMNTGSVDIESGDLVVSLRSSVGSTLDTIIVDDFSGLSTTQSRSYMINMTYDIIDETLYSVRVAIPGGKSMSDSCTSGP